MDGFGVTNNVRGNVDVVEVPDIVRTKALQAGLDGWLRGLPALVADLEREWSIRVGRTLEGGTEAYVAEATAADGTPAVLKLLIPHSPGAARRDHGAAARRWRGLREVVSG
jgi:streptomycin 6-kinase